jgi:hypothetical protein
MIISSGGYDKLGRLPKKEEETGTDEKLLFKSLGNIQKKKAPRKPANKGRSGGPQKHVILTQNKSCIFSNIK